MQADKKQLLKSYLSNLNVQLTAAHYTHCWEGWKELDYKPDYNKFYFICDGGGWLKVGGKEYYPEPGQLFLMPRGVLQSFSTIDGVKPFTKYWCHFNATVGEISLFDVIQLPCFIQVKNLQQLENLFSELIYHSECCDISSSLKVKALLLQLIAFYLDNTVIEDVLIASSTAVTKISTILEHIDRHIGENISVEELARIVHFHPNYFIKFFRTHLGISPIHYIGNRKIDKAGKLLKSTDMSVTEIAEATGYRDLYYFSKNFRQHTGFSPSEYRNLEKQMRNDTKKIF